jgi:hypothetical protein
MMLQSKLADTSIGFKDVLEIRTQVRSHYEGRSASCSADPFRHPFAEHEGFSRPNRTVHVQRSQRTSKSIIWYVPVSTPTSQTSSF